MHVKEMCYILSSFFSMRIWSSVSSGTEFSNLLLDSLSSDFHLHDFTSAILPRPLVTRRQLPSSVDAMSVRICSKHK